MLGSEIDVGNLGAEGGGDKIIILRIRFQLYYESYMGQNMLCNVIIYEIDVKAYFGPCIERSHHGTVNGGSEIVG